MEQIISRQVRYYGENSSLNYPQSSSFDFTDKLVEQLVDSNKYRIVQIEAFSFPGAQLLLYETDSSNTLVSVGPIGRYDMNFKDIELSGILDIKIDSSVIGYIDDSEDENYIMLNLLLSAPDNAEIKRY